MAFNLIVLVLASSRYALAAPVSLLLTRDTSTNTDSAMNSIVFIVIGVFGFFMILVGILCFCVNCGRARARARRRHRPRINNLSPATSDELRGGISDYYWKAVLSKPELDKMFPAEPYSKFLTEYNAENRLHNKSLAASDKPLGAHDAPDETPVEALAEVDLSTIQLEEEEEEPKFLCAICQQFIGQEDAVDVESLVAQDDNMCDLTDTTSPPHYEMEEITETHRIEVGPEVLIRHLSCNHIFHDECIIPWLTTQKAICPLCQHSFT